MHRPAGWIVLIGALTLAVLMLPFAGLLLATPWLRLHLQVGDGGAIGISVGYTLVALLIVVIFGTPLAWWLARHSFRGKLLVDALVLLPLLAPCLASCSRSSNSPGRSIRCANIAAGSNPAFGTKFFSVKLTDTRLTS